MINQAITAALTNSGITVFSPDFVNGVLSPCNLVSYEVSLDKLIKDWLNIGLIWRYFLASPLRRLLKSTVNLTWTDISDIDTVPEFRYGKGLSRFGLVEGGFEIGEDSIVGVGI